MKELNDNKELKGIFREDQSDRTNLRLGKMNWDVVGKRDDIRLAQIIQFIKEDKLKTSDDYYTAGIVLHHGRRANHSARKLAVEMMKKAVEINPIRRNKWLLAATIDRELMDQNKPQIFGTQHVQNEQGSYELYKMDSTKISDIEREAHGVTIVADQAKEVERMNKKQLTEVYSKNNSIEEVRILYENDHVSSAEYDLSWKGISLFGYQLKRLGQLDECREIFELAISLYPNESDLYHSLGLLFEEIGEKDKALEMMKHSLELNPNYQEGINDLNRIKEKFA